MGAGSRRGLMGGGKIPNELSSRRWLVARGDRWSHAPLIPKTEWPAHDSTDAPRWVGSWEKGSRGRDGKRKSKLRQRTKVGIRHLSEVPLKLRHRGHETQRRTDGALSFLLRD